MSQRAYKRKYKPRKEMSLAELKRMVAQGHALSREKHGQSNAKRNWNAAPRTRPRNRSDDEYIGVAVLNKNAICKIEVDE